MLAQVCDSICFSFVEVCFFDIDYFLFHCDDFMVETLLGSYFWVEYGIYIIFCALQQLFFQFFDCIFLLFDNPWQNLAVRIWKLLLPLLLFLFQIYYLYLKLIKDIFYLNRQLFNPDFTQPQKMLNFLEHFSIDNVSFFIEVSHALRIR